MEKCILYDSILESVPSLNHPLNLVPKQKLVFILELKESLCMFRQFRNIITTGPDNYYRSRRIHVFSYPCIYRFLSNSNIRRITTYTRS